MKENDFNDFGKKIDGIIQSAIDSQNFSELNQDVRKAFAQASDKIQSGMAVAVEQAKAKMANENQGYVNQTEAFIREKQAKEQDAHRMKNYLSIPKNEVTSGNLMTIFGFAFSAIFGIGCITLFILSQFFNGFIGMVLTFPLIVVFIFFVLTLILGIQGQKKRGRIERFKQYVGILNGRSFCELQEFVFGVNRKKEFIIKDLQDMTKRGMFLEGHLDDEATCFMITDEVYRQYRQAQLSYRERQAVIQSEEAKYSDDKYTDEVREVLKNGVEYVKQIRACNDAIPGVEISNKINRLETIVANIFTQIEKNPELVSELGQFFNYYLPTTLKLLNAYRELDQQSVEGENISETKREIDRTLDTIITAFENILDNCYKDMNWDVLSDISVLNTMMAKDGLTGSDMINKKK